MGFWDEYKEIGGNFIKADEKQVLVDNGIPLRVTAIVDDPNNSFGQPRFVLTVMVPNPETGEDEERALPFPYGTGAESRDRMLAGMKDYLEQNEGEEVTVKIEKQGRAFYLRQA